MQKSTGAAANDVIGDEKWLKETFIPTVQQRGAAIIKARGLSSAASAANAVVDTVRSLVNDTPGNDWHSVAVCSDGSYGAEKGLISGFPIRSKGGKWEIVQGVPINDFSRERIDKTLAELKEEKSLGGGVIERLNRGPSQHPFRVAHSSRVLAKTSRLRELSLPAF